MGQRNKRGFTIIELILTMSIIAVLGTFFLNTYPLSRRSANDAKRKSDLEQYRTALELYANNNSGYYPIKAAVTELYTLCITLGLGTTCPKDPLDNKTSCGGNLCRYYYQTDATGSKYVLWAAVEKTGGYKRWAACSNGVTGEFDEVVGYGVCPVDYQPI